MTSPAGLFLPYLFLYVRSVNIRIITLLFPSPSDTEFGRGKFFSSCKGKNQVTFSLALSKLNYSLVALNFRWLLTIFDYPFDISWRLLQYRIGILEPELQRLHCIECFLFLWEGEMKYTLHLSSSLKTGWNTEEDGYHQTADRRRKLDFFESLKSAKLLKVLKGLHSSSLLTT